MGMSDCDKRGGSARLQAETRWWRWRRVVGGRKGGGLGTGIEVLAYGDGLKIFLNLLNNILISIYFTMRT